MTTTPGASHAAAALGQRLHSRRRLPPPEVRRAIRIASGVHASEIATLLGVTRQAVSKWERGLCSPSDEHLDAYVAILVELGHDGLEAP